MKKLYILLFTILISSACIGQTPLGAQDFEGAGTWSYTETPASYNLNSDVWAIVGSLSSISPQSASNFWGMRDLENANGGGAFDHTLAFPNISVSGETNILLTFYYYTIGFDNSDNLRVEFFYDDVSQGEEELSKDTGGAWSLYSKAVPNGTTNVKFTILARQNGGSDYAGFDNVLLQSGANTSPSLSIVSPTEGEAVNTGSSGLDAELEIQNFTVSGDTGGGVSDNTGDGFIKYSLDAGASVSKFDTDATNFSGLTDGAHTLYFELVDNAGTVLTTPVNATVNFTTANIIQSLPFFDPFNYTISENLGDQTNWQDVNSGDGIIVSTGSLSYAGLETSSGNSISFGGSGIESQIEFTPVTSGTLYASFIFKITDQTAITDLTDGGYFSYFSTPESFEFKSRVWAHANPDASGTTFDIGFGNVSSSPSVSPSTSNIGDSVFVVVSYEFSTGLAKIWINPAGTDLGAGAAPTETFSETDPGNIATELSQFNLRQDSTTETPEITFDELRIGTTWADVTPAVALSSNQFDANSFNVYPNPTNTGFVNLSSKNNSKMSVRVFDLLGKQVLDKTISNNTLDVSGFTSGVYIIKVSQDNATITKKLVIQ